MDPQSTITVRHNPGLRRYEVADDGTAVGWTEYVPFDGPGGAQRIFWHTVVDDAYAGQGLASKLARYALDRTAEAGLPVVVVCPYLKKWLGTHPEYAARTVPVRPEHLAVVPDR